MDDLVTWLRVQRDDDERVAGAATDGPWWVGEEETGNGGWEVLGRGDARQVATGNPVPLAGPGYEGGGVWERCDAEHIARHGPARVLAEVDAKRRRLDLIVELAPHHPEVALRLAKLDALPYAARPGYRDEWKP